jgi:hypothetical protein
MKRKDDFLLQKAGNTHLLVPLGAQVKNMSAIVILNETGRYVWTLLQQDQSLDDLTDAVANKFVVERARAYADVRCFLDELACMGLLA